MRIRFALFTLALVTALTGCVDPTYTISTPANGAKYVGTHGQASPGGAGTTLPEKLIISYSQNPTSLRVYLNGQQVGDKMTYTPTHAEVAFSQISDFLKQGTNTLSVEPLAFGPTHVFTFDNEGPGIVITGVAKSGGNVTVDGYVTDASQVSSVRLDTYDYGIAAGTDSTGNAKGIKQGGVVATTNTALAAGSKTFSLTIAENDVYSFVGEDENGYVTTNEYMSTDQTINPVFKMRVSNTLLDSVKPLASAQGDNVAMWSNYAGNLRGKTAPAGYPDNIVLNAINENHSAIYTEIGAANSDANQCHEKPLTFTCNTAIYINDNSDGTIFNKGDAYTAMGGSRGRAQNKWFCESWSFTPSPDAGNQSSTSGSLCSYVEIYRLKIENLTINTLELSKTADSELNLGMLIQDSDGDNQGLDVNLGIYDWQCGPFEVPVGPVKALCDYAASSACTKRNIVRLPWTDENANAGTIASQVNDTHWCSSEGPTVALGLANLSDIFVADNNTNLSGGVNAKINAGVLDFSLKDGFSLGLSGDAAISGVTLGVIDLGGLLSALLGLLEPLFVDITESVVKNSLKDFDLDFLFTTLLGSKFEVNTQAWEIHSICTMADNSKKICDGTTAAATDVNWSWLYRGRVKTTQAATGVSEVLGAKFVESSLNDPLDDASSTTDNFSIALNQNIINQALSSFYNVGLTHFTYWLPLGVVELGPGATDAWGADGDKRLLLDPKSPPTFDIRSGSGATAGTVQATLSYTGAALRMQTKAGSGWNNDITIDVDIEAGVLMRLNNQKLEMTLLGTPDLKINNIDLPDNVAFIEPLVQPVVDIALNLFVPAITDTFLEIDLTALETGDLVELSDPNKKLVISTEGLEANNDAHLGFSMGINIVDK